MNGRLSLGVVALATAALLAVPATPAGRVQAQQQQVQGRFKVLVPELFAQQDADKGFGKDVAKELRKLLNTLPTHQPIEEGEIKDNLKKFKMKMDELDCIKTRQLASQMNAQVALCASYTQNGDQETFNNIQFWDIGSSESLDVDPVTVAKSDEGKKQAAQDIFDAFDKYVQLVRFQQFCSEYAQSQQWDNALRNCDQALALNPGATETRYRKARILYDEAESLNDEAQKQDLYKQSYAELQKVLAANEFHEDALQLAGYEAIQLGDPNAGREYYSKYLDINPNADQVRLKIAYDMAKAGDPLGAAQLVKVGLDNDAQNPDLLEYYGSYLFSAAESRANADSTGAQGQQGGGEALSPEARQMYQDAIDAFQKAYTIRGADMAVGHLRNIIAAQLQLGQLDEAAATAEKVLQTHPDEASIWAIYADTEQKQGNLDKAIAALDKVAQLQPDYPNLFIRQGNWLLQAGRPQDALPYFKKSVTNGQDPNTVARVIFADAHNNGVKKENFDYAIKGIETAKQFDVNADTKAELNFWEGWSYLQMGIKEQKPQTLKTAKATEPMFEQALKYFQASKSYADKQPSINYGQMVQAAQTYIDIQNAIIKRGG